MKTVSFHWPNPDLIEIRKSVAVSYSTIDQMNQTLLSNWKSKIGMRALLYTGTVCLKKIAVQWILCRLEA